MGFICIVVLWFFGGGFCIGWGCIRGLCEVVYEVMDFGWRVEGDCRCGDNVDYYVVRVCGWLCGYVVLL